MSLRTLTPASATLVALLSLAPGCNKSAPSEAPNAPPVRAMRLDEIPGHDSLAQDTSPKTLPRLVPAEAYIRTLLSIFGGLAPMPAQTQLQGQQLFDTWNDYLGALGLPDRRADIPRGTQTNALMIAAFERIGVALCDRALQHDLLATPATPVADRFVYAFDLPAQPVNAAGFATRFDVMHRTFLGYPAAGAPADRIPRFFALYQSTVAAHAMAGVPRTFTPTQAGWAAVCYGLVRHPEFHVY